MTFEGYLVVTLFIALFVGIANSNKKKKQQQQIIEEQKQELEQKEAIIESHDTESNEAELEQKIISQAQIFPYRLTNTVFSNKEYKFYLSLKPIADKYGYIIFTKMRIADLVYMPKDTPEYTRWFNYIKAKHIDFILCDNLLKPRLVIEVDDNSHNKESRKRRDEFVDKVFSHVNLPILHIRLWSDEELEKSIVNLLKINLV